MDLFEWLKSEFNIEITNRQQMISAFTHSSYLNEHKEEGEDYQRLEFLGDAVVEIWVSKKLFNHKPQIDEGKMTTMRAQLVCEKSFSNFARQLQLGRFIRLGFGEDKNGARDRDSLLSDIFEAFIGALYLDCGYNTVNKVLNKTIDIVDHPELTGVVDYKSQLQEYVQMDSKRVLRYDVLKESGPSNNPEFVIGVYLDDILLGKGKGHSKKKAEQEAARVALEKRAV